MIHLKLKNLSERDNSIQKSERLERQYYRSMDRNIRTTNPQNYNKVGIIFLKNKKTPKILESKINIMIIRFSEPIKY